MSPEKKVKLNESPEINLVWTMIYYRKVSEILKHGTHVGARSVAFFLNIFLCQLQNYFFVLLKWQMSMACNHSSHPHM